MDLKTHIANKRAILDHANAAKNAGWLLRFQYSPVYSVMLESPSGAQRYWDGPDAANIMDESEKKALAYGIAPADWILSMVNEYAEEKQ